jgi:hypothetical protein
MNYKHGMCAKLGMNEFNRRNAEVKRRESGIAPRKFTGLSMKTMTCAEYHREWRRLRREAV